ncbi:SRPBCC family protein [Antribacter gilvus]|uniref:SRPBCC family protein n=1 Tax=Antribacter gilvus TaxID=2304675 RepID=UPI000F7AE949|nr:SRPBCC family protein [Antribacter gilvus]
MAAVDVRVERVIHAPLAEVAAYAADPSNAPEWYANIRSVEWRTGPPVRVGSEMDFVARFLGRRIAYTYRVEELAPGQRLVMATAQGPFPMRTEYTWEPADGGTRMTLRNTGDPSGFASVAAPVLEAAMRRATTKDLERLARIIEGRAETPGRT